MRFLTSPLEAQKEVSQHKFEHASGKAPEASQVPLLEAGAVDGRLRAGGVLRASSLGELLAAVPRGVPAQGVPAVGESARSFQI